MTRHTSAPKLTSHARNPALRGDCVRQTTMGLSAEGIFARSARRYAPESPDESLDFRLEIFGDLNASKSRNEQVQLDWRHAGNLTHARECAVVIGMRVVKEQMRPARCRLLHLAAHRGVVRMPLPGDEHQGAQQREKRGEQPEMFTSQQHPFYVIRRSFTKASLPSARRAFEPRHKIFTDGRIDR